MMEEGHLESSSTQWLGEGSLWREIETWEMGT